MDAARYVGDEVAAAGFRLAGVAVCVPAAGEEGAALAEARAAAGLVLLSATVAACLPPAVLQAALHAAQPLTVVVPDLRADTRFADLAAGLRRQLGIEA